MKAQATKETAAGLTANLPRDGYGWLAVCFRAVLVDHRIIEPGTFLRVKIKKMPGVEFTRRHGVLLVVCATSIFDRMRYLVIFYWIGATFDVSQVERSIACTKTRPHAAGGTFALKDALPFPSAVTSRASLTEEFRPSVVPAQGLLFGILNDPVPNA